MEKKTNKSIVLLMGFVIIVLIVLCLLFATGTINFKSSSKENVLEENNNNLVSFNEIVGTYEFKEDEKTTDDGTKYVISATLYLNDDGTFIYEFSNGFVPYTYYGNYVLKENNHILLNVLLYNPTSGAKLVVKHIKLDLVVDDDKNIVDETEESLSHVENNKILLNKISASTNEYKYSVYDNLDGKDVLNSTISD